MAVHCIYSDVMSLSAYDRVFLWDNSMRSSYKDYSVSPNLNKSPVCTYRCTALATKSGPSKEIRSRIRCSSTLSTMLVL